MGSRSWPQASTRGQYETQYESQIMNCLSLDPSMLIYVSSLKSVYDLQLPSWFGCLIETGIEMSHSVSLNVTLPNENRNLLSLRMREIIVLWKKITKTANSDSILGMLISLESTWKIGLNPLTKCRKMIKNQTPNLP